MNTDSAPTPASAPTQSTPAAAPAPVATSSGSPSHFRWAWAYVPAAIGLFAIGLLYAVGSVKEYVDQQIMRGVDVAVEARTAKTRELYVKDTTAAKEALGEAYRNSAAEIKGIASAVERLTSTQNAQQETIDSYLRSSVSPAAYRKLVDDLSEVKASAAKLRTDLDSAIGAVGATRKDVGQLNEYIAAQLYPAVAGLQQQLQALIDQMPSQREAHDVPVGIFAPADVMPTSDPAMHQITLQDGATMPQRR